MNTEAARIISALGGTGKVATLCEVSASAVSQWRDKGIPKAWLRYFRERNPALFKSAREAKRNGGKA